MRRIVFLFASVALVAGSLPLFSGEVKPDAHLKGAFRKPAQNGWIYVHLEGSPFDVGFQHGYLLAPEIQDAEKVKSWRRPTMASRTGVFSAMPRRA